MPRENEESVTNILDSLVRFDTLSWNYKEASNLLDFCKDYISRQSTMHIEEFRFNGYKSLVATSLSTRKPKLLLQSHIDVVPGSKSSLKIIRKGDKLFGRGVYDMKFATAVFLKILDEIDIKKYDFGIMLTSDEEIGGENGVKALLDNGFSAEVCVLPDAGENWNIETSHKGSWIFKIVSKGITSHGSRPWEGKSAITALVSSLSELDSLFTEGNSDKDTLNVNKIMGGSDSNQVADYAEALVNIRFTSESNLEFIKDNLRQIVNKNNLSIETLRFVKINKTDLSNYYVKEFINIARKHSGKGVQGVRSNGTSDFRYFAEKGIPTILMRPNGGGAHSQEEWISKKALEDYYKVVLEYVQKIAKI